MSITPFHRLNEVLEALLEKLFGLRRLGMIYERLAETTDSAEFLEQVLEAFSIRYEVSA
jgi:hypothetical protein